MEKMVNLTVRAAWQFGSYGGQHLSDDVTKIRKAHSMTDADAVAKLSAAHWDSERRLRRLEAAISQCLGRLFLIRQSTRAKQPAPERISLNDTDARKVLDGWESLQSAAGVIGWVNGVVDGQRLDSAQRAAWAALRR